MVKAKNPRSSMRPGRSAKQHKAKKHKAKRDGVVNPAITSNPFADLVKRDLQRIAECYRITTKPDGMLRDIHIRQRNGYTTSTKYGSIESIPRDTSFECLGHLVAFAERHMHALAANKLIEPAVDDDDVDVFDLIVDWTRLLTSMRLGFVLDAGNAHVPDFHRMCTSVYLCNPDFAYVLYRACRLDDHFKTPDFDLTAPNDQGVNTFVAHTMCLNIKLKQAGQLEEEEITLRCDYTHGNARFYCLINYIEEGLKVLPDGITYDRVAAFVQRSLVDSPKSFDFIRAPDQISVYIDMHIEPDKTLNYEQGAAQGPGLKMPLTLLKKFLPKNWPDFYNVRVEVWSPDHEGCIPSSMNYNPRNVDEQGLVQPYWGEFCADHPDVVHPRFHPFIGREIRYCLESALSTNKIDRWAGDNEVQVIVECNDFLK